jgi:hypothetical protein
MTRPAWLPQPWRTRRSSRGLNRGNDPRQVLESMASRLCVHV